MLAVVVEEWEVQTLEELLCLLLHFEYDALSTKHNVHKICKIQLNKNILLIKLLPVVVQ